MARILDYVSEQRARFLPKFTRQRTSEILKTLVIVVPLTLLIWIYAERAQSLSDSVQFSPKVVVANPALVASIETPSNGSVTLDVYGPRVQIEQLKREIGHRAMNNSLSLTLPAALARPGQQNLNVADVYNTDSLIINTGVTVTKANPTYVTVRVDNLIHRDVKITLPQNTPVMLQNVTFDPPTVSISGPERVVEAAYPRDYSTIEADIANQGTALTGGGTRTIDVKLIPPKEPELTMSPQTVKMTFEVTARDRDLTIPSVPIVVQKLLSLEKTQVAVKGSPLVQNVHIRGPANLISRFEGVSPQWRLTAVLRIAPDDVGKSDLQRVPDLMLLKEASHGTDMVNLPPEIKADPLSEVDFDVKEPGGNDQ